MDEGEMWKNEVQLGERTEYQFGTVVEWVMEEARSRRVASRRSCVYYRAARHDGGPRHDGRRTPGQ